MSLEDSATRHQVFLQRYAAGLGKRFSEDLFQTYQTIIDELETIDVPTARAARLGQLQLDIEQLMIGAYDTARLKLMGELAELGASEVAWSGQLLSANSVGYSVTLPAVEQITAAYMLKEFEVTPRSKVNLEEALLRFGKAGREAVKQTVKDGILLGETNQTIAQNIRRQQGIAKHHADTIARTATNHVSNVARSELNAANSDIVKQYEWLATLDSRTTLVCASRDGKLYPVSSDSPRPPAHFNCRSTTIPVIDPAFAGDPSKIKRPARGKDGKRQKVAGDVTFGQWLKRQPASFQDEYFSKFTNGKEKAKLFRKGGLPVDKFVDANGAEYNLQQLQGLNPIEFDKAGL